MKCFTRLHRHHAPPVSIVPVLACVLPNWAQEQRGWGGAFSPSSCGATNELCDLDVGQPFPSWVSFFCERDWQQCLPGDLVCGFIESGCSRGREMPDNVAVLSQGRRWAGARLGAGSWELQREAPGGSSGREGINKGICAQQEGPAGKAAALAAEDPCGSGSPADDPGPGRPAWCDPLLLSFWTSLGLLCVQCPTATLKPSLQAA